MKKDENRATLVGYADKARCCGGAVKLMLCVSIVRNKIIGALRVDDDFKINEKNIFG